LLLRSKHGIAPTEAGLILYRHAQLLLKQIEQAQIDIRSIDPSAGRTRVNRARDLFGVEHTIAADIGRRCPRCTRRLSSISTIVSVTSCRRLRHRARRLHVEEPWRRKHERKHFVRIAEEAIGTPSVRNPRPSGRHEGTRNTGAGDLLELLPDPSSECLDNW